MKMEYFLLQKTNKSNPLKLILKEDEVVVGRGSFKNNPCLLHVSRKHASFQIAANGTWFVKDLNSMNGVFLNGNKISKGLHALNVHDSISFGAPQVEGAEELEFLFCSKESTSDHVVGVRTEKTNHPSKDGAQQEIATGNQKSKSSLIHQNISATNTINEVKTEVRPNHRKTILDNNNQVANSSSFSVSKSNLQNKTEPKVSIKQEVIPDVEMPELQNIPCTSTSEPYEIVILDSDEDEDLCQFKCTSRGWKSQIHFNVKTEVTDGKDDDIEVNPKEELKKLPDILVKANPAIVKVEPIIKIEAPIDELGYSQHDEVILVSDDDDYLNFNSQGNNNNNISENIRIKDEPLDDLNWEFESACDVEASVETSNKQEGKIGEDKVFPNIVCEPIVENDIDIGLFAANNRPINFKNSNIESISEVSMNTVSEIPVKNISKVSTNNISEVAMDINSIPESESIHNIKKFINQHDPLTFQKAELTKQTAFVSDHVDFFPILSQDNSDEELPSENESKDRPKGVENKRVSKVLLTEPKPMQQRPKYQRGREEWFDDHSVPTKSFYTQPKEIATKKKNDSHRQQKKSKKHATTDEQPVKRKKAKCDLRQKVKTQMGHRIRAPNGGSAIPMSSGESKNSTRKDVRVEPVIEHKALTTKQLPERFASRTKFLLDPLPHKKADAKKKNASKGSANSTFKIPKLSAGVKNKVNQEDQSVCKSDNDLSSLKSKENKSEKDSSLPNTKFCQKRQNSPSFKMNKKINLHGSINQRQLNESSTNRGLFNSSVNLPMSSRRTALYSAPCSSNTYSAIIPPFHLSAQSNAVEQFSGSSTRTTNISISSNIKDPRLKPNENSNHETFSSRNQIDNVRPVNQVPPFNVCGKKMSQFLLPERLDADTLITEVLKNWNPSWLKQYSNIGKPPGPVRQNAIELPLAFESLHSYAMKFYALIRLELWENIYLDWKDLTDKDMICFSISQCIAKGDILVLHCESILNPIVHSNVRDGSLLIAELREKNRQEVIILFGYISMLRTTPLPNTNLLHKGWQQRPELKTSGSVLYQFHMKTKKKLSSLEFDKLMKATVVSYIRNKARLVDTFQLMNTSPITPHVLNPSSKTFSVTQTVNVKSSMDGLVGNYNEKQSYAIASFAESMKGSFLQPKILFLQGPPGTGKTHTIVGIVQALLRKENNNVKILITAPSNAAVDVIGRRLLQLKRKNPQTWGDKKFKIVRIGGHKQIHEDLQRYSLDSLTMQNSKKSRMKDEEVLKKTIMEKAELISRLQNDVLTMRNKCESDDLIKRKMNEINMEIRRKQHATDEWKNAHKRLLACNNVDDYSCKVNVLKKANIVLSTLGSCRLGILEQCFGPNSDTHFTCCIVDESTQCTEPELLQPLVFGLSKFILVGDHQQLSATVQSQEARDCYFERSFFERIHLFFQRNGNCSPIYMLTEQYRMHSKICSFPSNHFYSNKLVTNVNIDNLYQSFPLKPFIVLNITYGQESNAHTSKANALEAKSLLEVCKQLLLIVPKNVSLGIITPYVAQKRLYISELSSISSVSSVEVNTVDGFQGREKDIILVSCVRAKSAFGGIGFLSCKKRLNVAITRARMCLIIFGHLDSLKFDPNWTDLLSFARERRQIISVTDLQDLSFLLSEMKKN